MNKSIATETTYGTRDGLEPVAIASRSWWAKANTVLWTVEFLFEKRDLWIGIFWTADAHQGFHLYFTPFPTLVIHVKRRSY